MIGVLASASASAGAEPEAELEIHASDGHDARRTVDAGSLPWTLVGRHADDGVLVTSHGGYDAAGGEGLLMMAAEIPIRDRVTLRGAVSTAASSELLRPTAGLIIDVLRGSDGGLDLAIGAEYQAASSLSGVPVVVSRVAASTMLGALLVIANVAVGIGLDAEERQGAVNLAAIRSIGDRLHVGFDAQLSADLELDQDEPPGEREVQVRVGPVATFPIGRSAVSAGAGVTVSKLRHGDRIDTGAFVLAGVATVF